MGKKRERTHFFTRECVECEKTYVTSVTYRQVFNARGEKCWKANTITVLCKDCLDEK